MKPLIVANWKCNPSNAKEAKELFSLIEKSAGNLKEAEVVLCPPFLYIKNSEVLKTGAQNCFWEQEGAFTGEISASMIKDLGCEYVILGHSERRKYFQETDEIVNKKIKAVFKAGIYPILCIGETEEQRKNNETEKVLKNQLELSLKNILSFDFQVSKLSIAYEPIWAIGTGNACSKEDAKKAGSFIKSVLISIFGQEGDNIKILYGGSVKSDNAANYIKYAGFDGLLVGGASLQAGEFEKIIKSVI